MHAGLPYRVWEEKLASEIGETLKWNLRQKEEGLPADQAVRGIGGQQRVERVDVCAEGAEGVDGNLIGGIDVYHVGATFPRPTTSRDFVVMIVTFEGGRFDDAEKEEREGRSWVMASKPVEHPGVPASEEFIRGQYESVEMIREIVEDGSDEESNPVEWTMVTRSDPGGTIPRWMVEKGTPKSICTDAAKFLNWATRDPEAEEATKQRERLESVSKSQDADRSEDSASSSDLDDEEDEHHGLIASFGNLLNAGMERYAPQAVLDYMPQHSHQPSYNLPNDSKESQDLQKTKTAETMSQASAGSSLPAELNTSGDIPPDSSTAEIVQRNHKGKLSSHEKQLAKLAQEKRSIDAQLTHIRSDIESLGLRPQEVKEGKETAAARASLDNPSQSGTTDQTASPNSSTNKLSERTTTSTSTSNSNSNASASTKPHSRPDTPTPTAPATANTDNPELNKVASGLFREESKLLRRLSKIERSQAKEAAKIEVRQRKEAEKQDKARSRDEAGSLKRELESVRKECDRLKAERKQWLALIKSLQAENSKLAKQAGKEPKESKEPKEPKESKESKKSKKEKSGKEGSKK